MNDKIIPRLMQFRHLKEEIRGSKVHLIVGIDVAKDKHHAFFGTTTGRSLLRRFIFETIWKVSKIFWRELMPLRYRTGSLKLFSGWSRPAITISLWDII